MGAHEEGLIWEAFACVVPIAALVIVHYADMFIHTPQTARYEGRAEQVLSAHPASVLTLKKQGSYRCNRAWFQREPTEYL